MECEERDGGGRVERERRQRSLVVALLRAARSVPTRRDGGLSLAPRHHPAPACIASASTSLRLFMAAACRSLLPAARTACTLVTSIRLVRAQALGLWRGVDLDGYGT
jgi:hypothetical protein